MKSILAGPANVVVKRVATVSNATVTHHVLKPGAYSSPMGVVAWTDMEGLRITFTDAHGRPWERLGSGPPRRR